MCETPAARRLSEIFAERGISHQHIPGRMPQAERNQQWADYSTNPAGVLIATRIGIKTLESVFRCLDEAISRACGDVVIGDADQSELDRIKALQYASAELTPLINVRVTVFPRIEEPIKASSSNRQPGRKSRNIDGDEIGAAGNNVIEKKSIDCLA
jgi:superfamily II DNA/RNA helicase